MKKRDRIRNDILFDFIIRDNILKAMIPIYGEMFVREWLPYLTWKPCNFNLTIKRPQLLNPRKILTDITRVNSYPTISHDSCLNKDFFREHDQKIKEGVLTNAGEITALYILTVRLLLLERTIFKGHKFIAYLNPISFLNEYSSLKNSFASVEYPIWQYALNCILPHMLGLTKKRVAKLLSIHTRGFADQNQILNIPDIETIGWLKDLPLDDDLGKYVKDQIWFRKIIQHKSRKYKLSITLSDEVCDLYVTRYDLKTFIVTPNKLSVGVDKPYLDALPKYAEYLQGLQGTFANAPLPDHLSQLKPLTTLPAVIQEGHVMCHCLGQHHLHDVLFNHRLAVFHYTPSDVHVGDLESQYTVALGAIWIFPGDGLFCCRIGGYVRGYRNVDIKPHHLDELKRLFDNNLSIFLPFIKYLKR